MPHHKLSQIFCFVIAILIMAHFTLESSYSLNLYQVITDKAYAGSFSPKTQRPKTQDSTSFPSEQDLRSWLTRHQGIQTLTACF